MWLGLFDGLKFVLSRFDTFWGQGEPQVGDLLVSKNPFVQVDLEVILLESGKDLLQYVLMFLVSVRVHQQVINVHEHILNVP